MALIRRTETQIRFVSREQADVHRELVPHEPLKHDELFGTTLYTLISAGTELSGYTQERSAPAFPGYAAVFRVEAAGDQVTRFRPGEYAFCMGPHRSFQRVRQTEAVPIPEGLPLEQSVIARLMAVSMTTLVTTAARPGQLVLVTGLGPVGHLAAQIFQSAGYEVIACDPMESRREQVLRRGIPHVFSSPPLDDPRFAGRVALAADCSGHEQAVLDGCRMVRRKGEVVLIGVPWRRLTDLTAHQLLSEVFHRYAVIRSGWEWEIPTEETADGTPSIMGHIRTAMSWIAEGRVRVDGLYELVPPEQADGVYRSLLRRERAALMTIFDWTQSAP
jgi:threonine dehydrogenase-like Zn-dependent dehydrogenase